MRSGRGGGSGGGSDGGSGGGGGNSSVDDREDKLVWQRNSALLCELGDTVNDALNGLVAEYARAPEEEEKGESGAGVVTQQEGEGEEQQQEEARRKQEFAGALNLCDQFLLMAV